MKLVHWLCIGCLSTLIACSGSGGSKAIYHPDVGPFDENGDYVSALADAPVRKNIFSRSKRTATPKVEKVLAPARQPVQQIARVAPAPSVIPAPASTMIRPPASVTVPQIPAGSSSGPVLIAQSPRRTIAPTVAPVPVAPAPVAAPKPAPKPKPVVVKPKKKTPVRHVVRKSDTLFGLSRKYGVSVGAIQRANGLKGTTIITGKSLLIPK